MIKMSRTKRIKPDSPSKQLRNVFFALFDKDSEDFDTFDEYYDSKMHKLIKHYKKLI